MTLHTPNNRWAQLVDFITAVGGFYLSFVVYSIINISFPTLIPPVAEIAVKQNFPNAIIIGIITVILFHFYKAYNYQRFTSLLSEYLIILNVNILLLIIVIIFVFIAKYDIPRTLGFLFWIITLFLFIVQKTILYIFASYIRKKGKDRRKIIIIGSGTRARTFIETVKSHFNWGLDIVGILSGDKENVGNDAYGYPVIGSFEEITDILKTFNPEEVIITVSTKRFDRIRSILEVCEQEGVQVRLYSDFFGKLTKKVKVDHIYGLDIISFTTVRHSELDLFMKRIMDILGSIIAILLFSPVMIIAAIGIWITDGSPIIYKWNVIGLNKKPFSSWKFRTMVRNADELKEYLSTENEMTGPVFKIKDDPRIFPFGRTLRKWSIDETPQLFSVLLGDMSLVGPRPAGCNEIQKYESWHRRRLSVKPGLTCLWQVGGRNGINNFDEWVNLDLRYIDNWSLWLDIKILTKTIPAVISKKGAS